MTDARKVVPREPTQAMIEKGWDACGPTQTVKAFWYAMYDAAPAAPASGWSMEQARALNALDAMESWLLRDDEMRRKWADNFSAVRAGLAAAPGAQEDVKRLKDTLARYIHAHGTHLMDDQPAAAPAKEPDVWRAEWEAGMESAARICERYGSSYMAGKIRSGVAEAADPQPQHPPQDAPATDQSEEVLSKSRMARMRAQEPERAAAIDQSAAMPLATTTPCSGPSQEGTGGSAADPDDAALIARLRECASILWNMGQEGPAADAGMCEVSASRIEALARRVAELVLAVQDAVHYRDNAEAERDKATALIEGIAEYWNGHETEAAMSDALDVIVARARAYLAALGESHE